MVLKDGKQFLWCYREQFSLFEQASKYSKLFHTGKKIKYTAMLLPVLFLYLCFLVCDNAYLVSN